MASFNPISDSEVFLSENDKNRLRARFGEEPTLEHLKWEQAIRIIDHYFKFDKNSYGYYRFTPKGDDDMCICTSDDFETAFSMANTQIKRLIINEY